MKLKEIKPIYKFLIFGVIPVVVILMYVYRPNQAPQEQIEQNTNSFFVAPENQTSQEKKSNIDLYKEGKQQKQNNNTFGGALDFDTKAASTDTALPPEEKVFQQQNNIIPTTAKKSYIAPSTTTKQVVEPVQQQQQPSTTARRRDAASGGSYGSSNKSTGKTTGIIQAVIHNGNKTVKSGSTVRLRTTEACTINGIEIPTNTVISGIAQLSGERAKISVTSIKYNGELLPCKFTIYDNDGIEGLFVPGGVNQEIKESTANSAVNEGATHFSVPVIGSVSTNAFKKKMQDPSVLIYDNHKVTLRP
ncbi:MAG: conjugative transposon protein TraM [Flavobacteriales bacterium]|nr:conjugative transposon protein TraM [Flavobacteriales bacterium]